MDTGHGAAAVLPAASGRWAVYLDFLGHWLGEFEEGPQHPPGYRMTRAISFLILWLSLAGGLAQSDTSPDAEESYSDWGPVTWGLARTDPVLPLPGSGWPAAVPGWTLRKTGPGTPHLGHSLLPVTRSDFGNSRDDFGRGSSSRSHHLGGDNGDG